MGGGGIFVGAFKQKSMQNKTNITEEFYLSELSVDIHPTPLIPPPHKPQISYHHFMSWLLSVS